MSAALDQTLLHSDSVRERIEALAQAQGGIVRKQDVVADARREDSPLHALFDWDVQRAAEAHWLDRAGEILRAVRIRVEVLNSSLRIPMYVHSEGDEPGYTSIVELRSEEQKKHDAMAIQVRSVVGQMRRVLEQGAYLGELDFVRQALAAELNRFTDPTAVVRGRRTRVQRG